MLGPGRGLPCEADTEGSLVRDELSDLRGDINSALGRMVSTYFPGEEFQESAGVGIGGQVVVSYSKLKTQPQCTRQGQVCEERAI